MCLSLLAQWNPSALTRTRSWCPPAARGWRAQGFRIVVPAVSQVRPRAHVVVGGGFLGLCFLSVTSACSSQPTVPRVILPAAVDRDGGKARIVGGPVRAPLVISWRQGARSFTRRAGRCSSGAARPLGASGRTPRPTLVGPHSCPRILDVLFRTRGPRGSCSQRATGPAREGPDWSRRRG